MVTSNRIFCTFTSKEDLKKDTDYIVGTFTITGGKIFTLQSIEQELFLLTYNLDFGNLAHFPKNTILVHRKKGYNVLYTINALNLIVKQLTGGFVDQKKNVDWGMYRNSLLLTESTQLKQIKTKLFSIKSLEL